MRAIQRIALVLVIIGAINWGLIGFFRFDLVASLFGGQDAIISRIVYALVGLSGLVAISILFMPDEEVNADIDRRNFRNLNYNTEFGEEADFGDARRPLEENSNDNRLDGSERGKK